MRDFKNFRYVAETCPGNIFAQRFYHFSDEIFTALDLTVSKHFLQNFGGLFTENFYGVARKETEIGKSILVHVILPYLKVKVERLYERWIIGRFKIGISCFAFKHPNSQGPISWTSMDMDMLYTILIPGHTWYVAILPLVV